MPWAPLMKLKQTETVTETLQAIALRGSRGLVPRQRHDRDGRRPNQLARRAGANDNRLLEIETELEKAAVFKSLFAQASTSHFLRE
jgi:hypothetical protein